MENKNYVCYEDFGAVGDGKTDDYDAIARAHAYANENGLKVKTDGTKTYYIGDTSLSETEKKPYVSIKTDVDWSTSRFIIDDSEITVDMVSRTSAIFVVEREHDPVVYTLENDTPNGMIARINKEGGFKTDIREFDIGIGYEALLLVRDDNNRVYIRYGPNKNDGEPQNELICVDADGNIDPSTPFLLDYKGATRITVIRADDTPITVSGGIFTTIANRAMEDYRYYSRNMIVRRSNVTVDNLTYLIEGEGEHGDPYAAFLDVQCARDVLIKDSSFQAHRYYMCVGRGGGAPVGMGTYAISAHDSNNVIWRNCKQSNFFNDDGVTVRRGIWSIMGSSGCKNLVYENSLLTRFDAHGALVNARLSDSTLTDIALSGGGEMVIENAHVYTNRLVEMRADYGSTWNGKIFIKNVTIHNTADDVYLLCCGWFNHDFGYTVHAPEELYIDGIELTRDATVHLYTERYVEQTKNAMLDEIDGNPNINKIVPPKRITVKNCKGNYKFVLPDSDFFKDTEFVIENSITE